MGTEGLGAAHDGPQVLRVREAVYRHQQRGFADAGAPLDQGWEVEGLSGSGLQGDALVHRTTGELSQPRPGDLFHQHTGRLRLPQQLQKFGAEAHLRRAPHPVNRPATLQGGLGRVASPDQVRAGVNAVALGLTRGREAVGIHDQGLGREAARAPTGTFKPGSPKTAPFRTAPGGAASLESAPLGTATPEAASFRAPPLKAAPLRTTALKTACLRTTCIGTACIGTACLKPGPLGPATLNPTDIGPAAHGTAPIPATGLGPPVVGLAVERRAFAPAAGSITTPLPARLVAIASPFGLGTTEAGGASSPAAPAPRPLVRTAFKSWAHGVSRWLWIDLLQVI